MIKNILSKIMTIFMLLSLFISYLPFYAMATDINSGYVYSEGSCDCHLKHLTDSGVYKYVVCHPAYYNVNGTRYPAYCLDVDKDGAYEAGAYTVSVSDVLGDIRIWRTITAGYPYRANGYGLSNDDYYLATKQAVYSVLYGWDIETKFQGTDATGNAIKNCIRDLVNEGRYGSRTRTTPQISVNKVGTFKLDSINNNYYSQEYSVSSTVNMANYTITDVLGFPSGTLLTNMSNGSQTTFSSGSHFKVLVPVSALENEISGTIVANGKCESYPIFYGRTPNSSWQNYALTYDPYSNTGGRANLKEKVVGTVNITKVQYGNTKNKLEGAKYNIYKDVNNNKELDEEDTFVIETSGTNTSGETKIQLGIGNYIAKESVAPIGYNLSLNEYPFSFTPYELNASFTDQDIIITGGLNMTKVDREDESKRLNGAKYKIYRDSNNNKKYDDGEEFIVETETTDDYGLVAVENLTYGHYVAKESEAPSYYDIDEEDIPFFVEKQGQIINIIAKDVSSKGNISITKTSEDGQNIEGIKFRITGTSFLGQKVDEIITTNSDGIATLENIQIGDSFKAEEINVPEGYVKPEDQIFSITANETTNLSFYNAIIKGKITIEKRSSEDNELSGLPAGTPLPNTEYTIYDKDMNVLQVIKTGSDGKATTDYIKYGKVYIKETKAPTYYLIDDAVHEMFIKKNEVVEFFAHTDKSVKIKVDVYKQGIKQTTCGQEIRYDFSNIQNNSNVPLDNFYWVDNLPSEVRINNLFTGTYNQDLKYTISYKTNKKDWVNLDSEYSTQVNNYIDFKSIVLDDDEFITDYRLNFGTTNPGFSEVEKPFIFVSVNEGLESSRIFTNYTTVGGSYLDKSVSESSKWSTCLYEKRLNVKKLPKTGF